jgi:hypothetical protein
MTRWIVGSGLVVLALTVAAYAADKEEARPAAPAKNAGLEKLKKLAGEWVTVDDKGNPTKQVVSIFKVTANGSAVHETIFPGTDHEMITVYHRDGADLVLTHYCAMGNQPHLKLDPKSLENKLVFQFVGGANIDPKKDMHMHEGSITIIDNDTIEWQWVGYKDGKPMEDHKVAMKLARKK